MSITPEDVFADALQDLIENAASLGLYGERDVLRALQLARAEDAFRHDGKVAAIASNCVDVVGMKDRTTLKDDPGFPPPGWTGLPKKAKDGDFPRPTVRGLAEHDRAIAEGMGYEC